MNALAEGRQVRDSHEKWESGKEEVNKRKTENQTAITEAKGSGKGSQKEKGPDSRILQRRPQRERTPTLTTSEDLNPKGKGTSPVEGRETYPEGEVRKLETKKPAVGGSWVLA